MSKINDLSTPWRWPKDSISGSVARMTIDNVESGESGKQSRLPGVFLLNEFADVDKLMPRIGEISAVSPFRNMTTPWGGKMSAAMTNCGSLGWIADRRGYRYSDEDPLTGRGWPVMPDNFFVLARTAANLCGFEDFSPDACLLNRYAPGAGMGAHQVKDEQDFSQPIVSVSLGLSAIFLFYGETRTGAPLRIPLKDGDVLVFGGPARRAYHGIRKLRKSPTEAGNYRFNLTFRRAR